jgi:hypothetical protein
MIPRWLCAVVALLVSGGIIALAVALRRSVLRRAEAERNLPVARPRIGGDQ